MITKTYEPNLIEAHWYAQWLENNCFKSTPDHREPYTIVIPPPNVTGILHMGHMLNNTIQDMLIRKARLDGKNACWVPGTDHASIATETKVVNMLAEQGIKKTDIGREVFLKHAFEWKEKYGGIILEQLKKLGASCDWDRTRFTMEPDLSDAVNKVFVNLYNKGLVYRAARMVNWDPVGKTAVSDEEVNFKEVSSKLYYIKYQIVGSDDFVTVATVRPETIMADAAICVNPNDERYQHLKGKKVIIPLINKEIPIIEDEYVEIDFGTGCLKITPAHDQNDYNIGMKFNLPIIDILDDDGKLNDKAQILIGEDRFIARKKIAKLLEAEDSLAKVEDYMSKVGHSERTNAVIEPKISPQWFVKMSHLAEIALKPVQDEQIKFYPEKFKNTYNYWLENIKDWCISRQLWWGQQIPVYYLADGSFVVAETASEALELAKVKSGNAELTLNELTQDEDVVDTWFSSWLWPISVFDGFKDPENVDFRYYYPTNTLVTGHDIIFFWVARMIMAGMEFENTIPFKDVYFTGMVRDKLRRKMSKQLGNSPDPLMLIEKYGADGVRLGLLMSSPAGGDLLFDESLCEQGRNFSNKLFNAGRLINGWEIKPGNNEQNEVVIKWMQYRIAKVKTEIEQDYSKYRLSEVITALYKLTWDDICSNYLEMIKPPYGEAIDQATFDATSTLFEELLGMLHPITPFITESLWQQVKTRRSGEFLATTVQKSAGKYDPSYLLEVEKVLGLISELRNIRAKNNLPFKEQLSICTNSKEPIFKHLSGIVSKMLNLATVSFVDDIPAEYNQFAVDTEKFGIDLKEQINVEETIAKLKADLTYQTGFKQSIEKKLSNEKFVNGAPANVIEVERKKLADAEKRIAAILENLDRLA